MTSNVRLERLDREFWISSIRRFGDASFQQSWAYAEVLASRRNCLHEEVGFWEGDELVGLASVRVRQIPVLGLGVAYVAGGPLVNRSADDNLLKFKVCLKKLREEYVEKRGLVLRILAPVGDHAWNEDIRAAMSGMGMVPSQNGRSYRTLLLDLDRPLDEIRKGFAQKWRNCLNASEKEGLSIRWTSEPRAFSEFRVGHEAFVRGKGFSVNLDAAFYESVRNHSDNDAALELALVECDGKPIAFHLGSYLGDTAVYLLGLTEELALSKKAAYFLHWEVINRAKGRGLKWYDLGGIDPDENPGVFKFKSGLGGNDVCAAGPMEMGPGRIRLGILRCIEGILNRTR